MKNKKTLIYGLSGYAKVAISVVKRENRCEIVEFTDNDSELGKEKNDGRGYE